MHTEILILSHCAQQFFTGYDLFGNDVSQVVFFQTCLMSSLEVLLLADSDTWKHGVRSQSSSAQPSIRNRILRKSDNNLKKQECDLLKSAHEDLRDDDTL